MSMQVHELTHPPYATEREGDRCNPVTLARDTYLPGVHCDRCGQTWSGSRRTYLPIADPALRAHLSGPPLPWAEWRALAEAVRQHVGLPEEALLWPGDVLGAPTAVLHSASVPDFLHPAPGQLIVREPVAVALQDAGVTGVHAVPVKVGWADARPHNDVPPALYELVVTGVAWRRGVSAARIIQCEQCRRTIFPPPYDREVDATRWDGSDFFHVDRNPNIVLVTPRVCALLASNGFTNWRCVDFPESIASTFALIDAIMESGRS